MNVARDAMKRRLAAGAFALGASAFACQIVAGIERVDKIDPPDAGLDASPTSDAAPPPDPCRHVTPPPPPLVDDAPNDRLDDVYLALRTITMSPPGGEVPGFDLDLGCTCDPRPDTAFLGRPSCSAENPEARPHCDLDGGIDNQLALVLKDYASFIDIDQTATVNDRAQRGRSTAIVVITKYNGRANDKEVGFGLFTSAGMREPSPCPGSVPLDGFYTPGWCGKDPWTASSTSVTVTGSSFIPNTVGTGYVTDYRFVTTFNGVATIPFAGYDLAVGSPVSSGRLVPLDDNQQPLDTTQNPSPDRIKFWRIEEATLSGRIPVSDLLAALGTIDVSDQDAGSTPLPLCNSPVFATVKASLCSQLDVTSTSALDFAEGARCDAVSVGVSIRAESCEARGVVAPEDAGNDCYPIADGGGPIKGPPNVDYRCP